MRNPVKNAWNALKHDRRHLVFAIFHRMPWLIPNDELYLKIYYWLSLKKKLRLNPPILYNEKLQWLKLHDRRPEYVTMVDKYAVKDYVSKIIGDEYVVPAIDVWEKPDKIEWEKLPEKFVLKTNHDGGGNGIVLCKDKNKLNKKKALHELSNSFKRNTYLIGREWPYKLVNRCVFAEQYMEDSATRDLRDYKFYCFDGEIKVLLVATNRNTESGVRCDFFDPDFNHLDIFQGHPWSDQQPITKPVSFDLMKKLVVKLSQGIPHVRVDFYEVDGHPYFGEFTFFDSGGTGEFQPEEWNKIFGDWIKLPM